ncbi:hypothetical protein GCM10027563_08110 [Parasphingorhabdus pacifica]
MFACERHQVKLVFLWRRGEYAHTTRTIDHPTLIAYRASPATAGLQTSFKDPSGEAGKEVHRGVTPAGGRGGPDRGARAPLGR